MKTSLIVITSALILVSCKDKQKAERFEVTGKLINSPERVVYLEEVPMATMTRTRIDSAILDKEGEFILKASPKEEMTFLIRVGNNDGPPLAAVINDSRAVTVNATYAKGMTYAETYDVKGSPASADLKSFMVGLNTNLQTIYFNRMKMDSLQRTGASDSLIANADAQAQKAAQESRELFEQAIRNSKSPALSMFVLGNYQAMANNPAFQLTPVANDEVAFILKDAVAKFPKHAGVAAIKQYFDNQVSNVTTPKDGWVGKKAPEFSMPDPNGNTVSLSSFRGKYVLVDFWASWCSPCRHENPNVVAAYKKFKGANFDILGVSLDKPDGKQDWLDAIREDGLAWTQISDLKFWESSVVQLYGFGEVGIPYNILVDPQGTIIAERLTGPALENKLTEVLK